MSKADKMFEELGYKKENCYGGFMFLNKESYDFPKIIHFDFVPEDKLYIDGELTPIELKAVFERCKELGWLE